MSEYLIILHDAEPPTPTGRDQLQQELVSKLGIGEDAVKEMFASLPVILKENVSREHAEDFLRILEAMGANVEILASNGENQGETPLLQLTDVDLANFENGKAQEESLQVPADESIEDLESILTGMLDEAPGQDTKPEDSIAETKSVDNTFVIEADKSPEVEADAGPSIDDLNKILEAELGVDAVASQEAPVADDPFVLDGLELNEEPPQESNLEAMFTDALASVEEAEVAVKAVESEPTPPPSEPTPSEATPSEATPKAAAEEVDISGLSLELEGDGSSGEVVQELSNEETVVETSQEAPNVADSGLTLAFDLEDDSSDEESALESALGTQGLNITDDDDEEDPFAGLSLPGEEPSGEEEALSSASGTTDKSSEKKEARKAAKIRKEEEELAKAFSASEAIAEEKSSPAPAVEETVEVEAEEPEVSKPAGKFSVANISENKKQVLIGVLFAILFTVAIKPDLIFEPKSTGANFDAEQFQVLMSSSAARAPKPKAAPKPALQRWSSKVSDEAGQVVDVEILSDGNKILAFEFLYEGAQPDEITPEELVDGIDRPWVRKVTAKGLSLAEVVERTTNTSKGPQKILIAESPARVYVSDLKGSSRFTGRVRVELTLQGAEKLSGTWKVVSTTTPNSVADKPFHVKRQGTSTFELALNGKTELTPLTLTDSVSSKKDKKVDSQE